MNILHVYKTSMPASYGGVETFIDTLCKADSKLGVKNIVFTLNPDPAEYPIKMNGYTVYQAKQDLFIASTGFSLSAFHLFKNLVDQVDIIHYHYPNPFADLLHMLCSPKKPSILTYHSDIIKQKYLLHIYSPLQRRFLNSVSHIVSTSPNYFVSSDVLQYYSRKVSVIPIGVDPNSYENVNQERLKYWRSRSKSPFFLFVGALRYYKGLHVALEAITGTQINFVIAGIAGVEQDLKKQVESASLKNVIFLGSIDDEDKVALLHLCYGFVFPSYLRSEAFGISLLEAAIVGKPMISCEIGTGTTFVNIHQETGLVINPSSINDLREAMLYLLDNPNVASEMGRNAKIRAQKLFTSEKQARSYYELARTLLARAT